jgi:virginiamycin B lyase
LGSDNNVWFGDENANFIAKIDAAGNIAEIPLPPNTLPFALTSGPDGNIWFSTNSGVGKLAPSSSTPTLYTLNVTGRPTGITSGPNNQIWFSESFGHRVGHIATDGSAFQEIPLPVPSASFGPGEVAMGSDGNIWTVGQAFSNAAAISSFVRITPTGEASFFHPPTHQAGLCCIASALDGFLYTTEREVGNTANIARISSNAGDISETKIPSGTSSGPDHITIGSDGNVWFTEFDSSKIGRLLLQ